MYQDSVGSGITRRQVMGGAAAGLVAIGAQLLPPRVQAWGLKDLPANRDQRRENPPQQDPCANYPAVPEIQCESFRLSAEGLSPAARKDALRQLHDYQSSRQAKTLGFQANQDLGYQQELKSFLDVHINNVGDPFQTGSFTLNSKWMERAVLDYYARLWHARWPHDPQHPESYWGYVLTMGSTEGNLYGLWNARDYLEGKCLLYEPTPGGDAGELPERLMVQQAVASRQSPHSFTPVAFYSADTHYSVVKAMRVLGIHTFYELGTNEYPGQCPVTTDGHWPTEVPSEQGGAGPGSIDAASLVRLVEFFASRGYPILICLNYGTTFKGAYDDVEQVGERLMPILKRHGLWERTIADAGGHRFLRNGFWIHVDAALAGSYMPFVEMAYQANRIDRCGPTFDFRLPFVHSMTMSGHKWIGAPWPCGVYMSKTKYLLMPPSRPAYIGSFDSTLAGSRNGYSAMILWDYLARHSYEDQIQKALRLEALAEYAYVQLQQLQRQRGDLWVARTPLSLTIRFRRPNPEIVFKYSLANETLQVDGHLRDYSHIYIMAHVTRDLIDELIADLKRADAFVAQDTTRATRRSSRASSPDKPDKADKPESAEVHAAFRTLLEIPYQGRGWR